MAYSLTWLPDALRKAGLKVAEQPGWIDRGLGPMGEIRGVICHHTGTKAYDRTMPTLRMLVEGVVQAGGKVLPGPLAQLGLGRDGTFHIIAAGRCNHAGKGEWRGITTGNTSFIGIEAENDGAGEKWPEVQLDAYRRGVGAILKHIGASADYCCGHKEFALPKGRKNDPANIDMADFRARVASLMAGTGVVSNPVIPAKDSQARPTLRRGDKGEVVRVLQSGLGINADGVFGAGTEAAVRDFQRKHNLVPDGIVGPKSWLALPNAQVAVGLAANPAEPVPAKPATPRTLAWGVKVSSAFRDRVFSICADLKVDPDYLMACMAFESGRTFSPSVQNAAGSGAVGLIQFMPTTAGSLGTTSDALVEMTAEDQLLYVHKYFTPFRGRLATLADVYMAILWPAAVGKADSHGLFVKDGPKPRQYLQNKGLDVNADGIVTKAEAAGKVAALLDEGRKAANLWKAD